MLENKETSIKMKKNYLISLVVIGLLIVLLLLLGYVKVLINNNPRNTYVTLINNMSDELIKQLDKNSNIFNKSNNTYKIGFDLETSNSELIDIANIINNINVDINSELDYKKMTSYINTNLMYKNGSIANIELLAAENKLYLKESNLYYKPIEVSIEEFDKVWEVYDVNSYKQVISKFKEILISNLKKDYFECEDEVIVINDNKIKVLKHILELDDDNLYDLKKSIIRDMQSNSELISALAKISGSTNSDIKKNLKETEKELVKEDIEIKLEIYLNKKNVAIEKIVIVDDLNSISFNRISDKEYQIENEIKKENIGYFIYKDEFFELNLDSEDKLKVFIEKNNIDINVKWDKLNISLKQEVRPSDTKITFNTINFADKTNFKVNVINVSKEIEEVHKFDVSQSILVNDINDQEYNNIITKLSQNSSYINLYQDIITIYAKNNLIINS